MRQAAARAFMCTQLKFAEFNVIIHFYSCLFKENFFNTAYLHWKRKENLCKFEGSLFDSTKQ